MFGKRLLPLCFGGKFNYYWSILDQSTESLRKIDMQGSGFWTLWFGTIIWLYLLLYHRIRCYSQLSKLLLSNYKMLLLLFSCSCSATFYKIFTCHETFSKQICLQIRTDKRFQLLLIRNRNSETFGSSLDLEPDWGQNLGLEVSDLVLQLKIR